MKNKTIIILQIIFLVLVISVVYLLYPKIEVDVDGDFVRFTSISAKVVMIADNPDFIEARYLDLEETKNISFRIKPGTYYWKADNGIIKGLMNEFVIDSEVGLKIDNEDNDSELVNIGNVKVNVTKEDGVMIGHIVLEPEESEEIENEGKYTGRQED